jgi:hypothetical protein
MLRKPQEVLVMLILKRQAVWLLETLFEAVLLGAFLHILWGPGRSGNPGLLAFNVLWALWLSVTTGYAVTTLICRLVWKSEWLLWYPFNAALLYVIHAQIFFMVNDAFTPANRLLLRVAGVCVVFVCAFIGSLVLQKWEETLSKQTVV